jgi:hypothetical protein
MLYALVYCRYTVKLIYGLTPRNPRMLCGQGGDCLLNDSEYFHMTPIHSQLTLNQTQNDAKFVNHFCLKIVIYKDTRQNVY